MDLQELNYLSIIVRVLLAAMIGLERESKNRPAGFRTYTLVSVGACMPILTTVTISTTFYGNVQRKRLP